MNLRRKIAVTFSALAMTIGGGILTATPAAADEPCSSGKLCLYRSTLFRTMELSTGSVSHCYALDTYNLTDPWAGIMSYRNNLPVKATIWWFHGNNYFYPGNWSAYATIAPGEVQVTRQLATGSSTTVTWSALEMTSPGFRIYLLGVAALCQKP